ncbi:MAG: tetratricopeptide repeat protein [Dehalococcoidia bacterium]
MRSCQFCNTDLPLLAAFCARCGNAVPPDGADLPLSSVIAQASALLSRGEVDRVIALLEPHALASEPATQATFALGAAYLQRGRYADALPLLVQTVERNPVHAQAQSYLGMAFLHTYQPAEARAALAEALRLAPDDFVVNLKYGEMLLRLGYYWESIPPLERALAAPSTDGNSLEFARRLLLHARQKAPNTFTRPAHPFPPLPAWLRRSTGRKAATEPSEAVS